MNLTGVRSYVKGGGEGKRGGEGRGEEGRRGEWRGVEGRGEKGRGREGRKNGCTGEREGGRRGAEVINKRKQGKTS